MSGTSFKATGPVFRRLLALLLAVASAGYAVHEIRAAGPPRRARPPKFDKSVRDVFFPDARQTLEGPRPQARSAPDAALAGAGRPASAPVPTAGQGWSRLIAAEAVEDEIKTQQLKLAETVANATLFKSGGYQKARTHLSVLAAMLAVVAEYDGPVRWQDEAGALGNLVARAGSNCKIGTDGSFKEASQRAEDLQTLVRGGALSLPQSEDDEGRPMVADRPPLMKRLDQAEREGIVPLTSNPAEFERNAEKLAHEAQVVAALAEIMTREGYEYADDETYVEYARATQAEALSLRDAALQGDYEQARRAAGQLSQACANCHDGYRG